MPSNYAHVRFGRNVLSALPSSWQKQIRKNMYLYLTGLHGPDLLFYYRPLTPNPVSDLGYSLHDWTGRRYFGYAASLVEQSADRDAAWAYLMGFVCHFTLDSFCHPYVDEKIRQSRVMHTEIEGAFDRALLIHDGLDPVLHPLTDHIIPSKRNAQIIAPFFPSVTAPQVQKAMHSMIFYCRLLQTDRPFRTWFVRTVLKASGHYADMHGQMIEGRYDSRFSDSNQKLYALYHDALKEAPELLREVDGLIRGSGRLGPRFDHTFSIE